MKATGVVRRIDDLGRVVLPKELRRTMGINNGDSLEIYIADGGHIILKKYDPIPQAMDQIDSLEGLILDGTTYSPETSGKAVNLLKQVKQLLND